MTGADQIVVPGIFSLDGEDFEVENNVWLVGDEDVLVVIDPAHDVEPILEGIDDRSVGLIICTHGHNDHINAAVDLAEATGAPIALHPADRMLWDVVHPDRAPDRDLVDEETFVMGGAEYQIIHTPGHTPGGVCVRTKGRLFTGDTLFRGGPGATGRSFSDADLLVSSIRSRIFPLPQGTLVQPGHGRTTTVGREALDLDKPKPLR